jgi:hypothetical protein
MGLRAGHMEGRLSRGTVGLVSMLLRVLMVLTFSLSEAVDF